MFKKICGFFSTLIVVCLVIVAIVLYLPLIIGGKSMAVLSGSMEPKIPVGSIVCTKAIEFDELKIGDVISYQVNQDVIVTHRINSIDRAKEEVVTKGDANNAVDGAPVTKDQIMGKVLYHLPYIGYISIYIKTPKGIMVVCGIVTLLILFNFLPEIFKKEEKDQNKL